ncbi:MAG TPA: hypothetical protein VHM70_03445 [Polyangiaceae bacterium]|jgi:hypothetical protein|nr:hypothetical protein [Polyangiaceae bacterium]
MSIYKSQPPAPERARKASSPAQWEDEVTARYDADGIRRNLLLVTGTSSVPESGVLTIEPRTLSARITDARRGQQPAVAVRPSPAPVAIERRVVERAVESERTANAQRPVEPSPKSVAVPLYVLKALVGCYTEYMGVAARVVIRQELTKLGVDPETVTRAQLPTLVGRLAARLDTHAAADSFLRAARQVDPALSTFG